MEIGEDNEHDVLGKILTAEELTQIPQEIGRKLTTYFTENFEKFITAKAIYQHGRQSLGNHERQVSLGFDLFISRSNLDFFLLWHVPVYSHRGTQ